MMVRTLTFLILMTSAAGISADNDPTVEPFATGITNEEQKIRRQERKASRKKSQEDTAEGRYNSAACTVPDCPIPELTYTPNYPPLGQYSIPAVCEEIHPATAPTVTLGKGERLASAVSRLQSLSPNGGVIAIPQGHPVQCDSLRLSEKTFFPSGITLKGIPHPDGKQPRFYCRSSDERYGLGGTIPPAQVEPVFFTLSGRQHHIVMIENIHVDGYKSALKLGKQGAIVVRNSWFHHGPLSGISSLNTGGSGRNPYKGIENHSRFSLEACGIEISHYGQANHTHNFYMHRGLGGGGEDPELMRLGAYDTWSEVTLVDSLCHSPGWASCYKSIANKNNIINNKFYSELVTDPSFLMKGKQAQMLIDVPSCSHNVITGNELRNFKPSKSAGGSAVIGIRGRRTAMRGCEVPLAWYPYTNKNSAVPLAKDADHPVHTENWWQELNRKILFPTILKGNLISVSGDFAFRQTAVHLYGTYWIYEGPKKVSCFLEAPDNWYERSRLYASNNTFIGFKNMEKIYTPKIPKHNKMCANQPRPDGPGPSIDLFEIGSGEVYKWGTD